MSNKSVGLVGFIPWISKVVILCRRHNIMVAVSKRWMFESTLFLLLV